jgi:hypothetical protein
MKSMFFAFSAWALAAFALVPVIMADDDPGQTGSSADPGQSGSADPGQTGSSQSPSTAAPEQTGSSAFQPGIPHASFFGSHREGDAAGVALANGTAYLVRGHRARPLTDASIPEGQMLTEDGQWVDIPAGLGDLAHANAAAPAGASTEESGIAIENGDVFLIRAGQAAKLDANAVPSGQMMTFDGNLEPLPPKVKGLPRTP